MGAAGMVNAMAAIAMGALAVARRFRAASCMLCGVPMQDHILRAASAFIRILASFKVLDRRGMRVRWVSAMHVCMVL